MYLIRLAVLAVFVVAGASVTQAACTSGSTATCNITQYNGTVPYDATGGTQARTPADRAADRVNASEYGTITFDNAYNSTEAANNFTAVQGAINYAVANGKQTVNLPCGTSASGRIWFPQTLFADVTANWSAVSGTANNGSGLVRVTVASTSGWSTGNIANVFSVGGTTEANGQWTITVVDSTHVDLQGTSYVNAYTNGGDVYDPVSTAASIWIHGCGGITDGQNSGTNLYFISGLNAPYLLFGPGRGMGGDGFSVNGTQSGACWNAYPSQSAGIVYAAGGSEFELDRVSVNNAYALAWVGYGGNSLADHATFNDINFNNGHYGLELSGGEPFIVNLASSSIGSADYIIYNADGVNVNVRGGSYASGGTNANAFGISSTSSLNGSTNQLSTTVASPDSQIAAGCYNSFVIKTADFGSVPFTEVSYSGGTITLQIESSWYGNNYAGANLASGTALATELQAATEIYAVQRYDVFKGGGFNVSGVHVEGNVPLTLVDESGASQADTFDQIRMNGDPSDSGSAACQGQNNACEARYLVAQTFPFLDLRNVFFSLSNFNPSQANNSDPFIIDDALQGSGFGTPESHNFSTLYNATPLIRWWTFNDNDDHEQYFANRYKGAGNWDHSYWVYDNLTISSLAKVYFNSGDNAVPYKGFRPIPWATPELTPNQYSQVSGSLPALGTYPLIYGGTIYSVQKNGDTSIRYLATSAHQFYSWGQNLTYPWSYKGASNCLYIGVPISGAANNGSGAIRLTVSSTSALTTGQKMVVSSVTGTTEANVTAQSPWTITVVDGTHVDLQGSTFVNAYVSGGFLSDTSMMFDGLAVTLNLSGIGNTQFVVTGVYPGQGFVTITYPGTISTVTQGVTINPGVSSTVYTGTTIVQQAYSWTKATLQ